MMEVLANRLASLANLRMQSLLNLRGTVHHYDPVPGDVNSVSRVAGGDVMLKHFRRAEQPYHDLTRFTGPDRIMPHVIDRGLLPIVTALAKEILGRKLLVTRYSASPTLKGATVVHLANYGIRIQIHVDAPSQDTIVAWECLYGAR
ncbi:MAG: hypothetical protein K2X03_06520 [Bryobacteraceae bacterium]|nr:hypothetical protein [Bryobacteraceae bacterium]